VYVRRLDPSVLPFSLSLYRHPSICILFRSHFTSSNKHETSKDGRRRRKNEVWPPHSLVWFTTNFVQLPPRNPLEKRVCHASNFLQFFYPKILSDEKTDEIQWRWCIIRVYKKTTYKSFTQLHLTNWPIRNYSSVQFLLQTLSGNTLVVGTKSIPSVSSVANHTGSGLLQSSVTWPLSGNSQW
jgi:hypothetical protein